MLYSSETIIVLRGRHAQHLMDLEKKAERIGLVHFLVQDAEKTAVSITDNQTGTF